MHLSPPGGRQARAQALTEQVAPAPGRFAFRLGARGRGQLPIIGAVLAALAVCGLLLTLTWPLFTDGARLQGDFVTDGWLITHQAESLRQSFFPSHFIHADRGIFYPVFAFYGGTLFALAGAITLIVGSALTAQAIVYVLALAAAYGGWVWLARLAGLRSWQPHVPAVLYVTAPYVITNVVVRQDLTETVATAVIPLLLASALSVLRADRLRAGPFAALALSTIFLVGSHNLTLLWATTILGFAAAVLFVAVPETRRWVTRRGALRVLAVVVPAVAVNAWYLFPDLAYHSHTQIAQRIDEWRSVVRTPNPAIATKYLFAVGRESALPGSAFAAGLPVFAMAWVLIAAIAGRRQWRGPWGRTLGALAMISSAVLVVMTHPRLITRLPDPWLMIQFSYRLETFVLFGICGAVIAALVVVNRSPYRWLSALLLPVTAFSVAGAIQQVRDVPRHPSDVVWTIDNLNPFSTGDFAYASGKDQSSVPARIVPYTRSSVHRDRLSADFRARPGEIIFLDLMVLPQMVDVDGAQVIGRWATPPLSTSWQAQWYLAVRIDDDVKSGRAHITVREARTLPIVGGRIISILGLLGLVANAAMIVGAGLRRRRAG